MLYYAITDRAQMAPDPIATAANLARRFGPRLLLQLREKDLSAAALFDLAKACAAAVRPHGARLLINDRADLARCLGDDVGVHLPESGLRVKDARRVLGKDGLIAVSCHDDGGVARAVDAGADIVTLAPIFESPGKGPPLGLSAITRARAITDGKALLFVLGGLVPEHEAEAISAGADGVAAIRSAWSRW